MEAPGDVRVQSSLQRYRAYVTNTNAPASAAALSCLHHRSPRRSECEQHEKCTLCLEELKEGEAVTELPCGHVFHKTLGGERSEACGGVGRWLQENRSCPQCRVPVVTSGEVPTASEQLLIPLILKQYRLIREQQRLINSFLKEKRKENEDLVKSGDGENGCNEKREKRELVMRSRESFGIQSSTPFVPCLRFNKRTLRWQAEFLRSAQRGEMLTKIWTILFSQLKQEAQGKLNTLQSEKLDRIAKRIESMLFVEARTFADYEDTATLQVRTMHKLHQIMRICRSAPVQRRVAVAS